MEHKLLPLFSTPLYQSTIHVEPETLSYIKNLDYQDATIHAYVSQSNSVLDGLTLKEKILDHVNYYCHHLLQITDDIEYYLLDSWAMKYDTGHHNPLHCHSNSLFSGVYYVNMPEDDQSFVEFHNNDPYNIFPNAVVPQLKNQNLFNSTIWRIKPSEGDLILFPSHLKHYVSDMTSTTEYRYCIAFNLFCRGQITNQITSALNLV
jgi:uncharacterized protein (TIGR02466 family)